MRDDKEAIEHAERERRSGKEIYGGNGLATVLEGRSSIAAQASDPSALFGPNEIRSVRRHRTQPSLAHHESVERPLGVIRMTLTGFLDNIDTLH